MLPLTLQQSWAFPHHCCTAFAATARPVEQYWPDPSNIKGFDVRFTSPVYAGETIETEIWINGTQLSFRCKVEERDRIVLNNGLCQLADSF